MSLSTRSRKGLNLIIAGAVGLGGGLGLTSTGLGACVGLPLMLASIVSVIWGLVVFYQGQEDERQANVAPATDSAVPVEPLPVQPLASARVDGRLKNPWTASLLNLLLTGLGYGYLGLWGRAATFFAAAIGAAIFTLGFGYLVPLAFSLVDSFILANKINSGEAVDNFEGLDVFAGILSKFFKK